MYLFIIFSFFGFQQAHARESCESRKVKLSDLTFLREPLVNLLKNPGECYIIDGASSDQAAKDKGCKMARVNPGNPQYIEGHGRTNDTNSLGYYFCVNINKEDICKKRKAVLSDKLDVRWVQAPGTTHYNMGDCKCKSKGDPGEGVVCPNDTTHLETGNLTGCEVVDSKKGDDGKCHCIVDDKVVTTGGSCSTEVKPPPVTENVDPADFDECLADLKTAKETCSEKGKAAIDKCSKDAPEVNKNISEAQRVLSIGLDAIMVKNAGSGALNACAKMGAAGTTAIEALSLLRENCKKELESCKKGCEVAGELAKKTPDEYVNACKEKFKAHQPQKLWTQAHEDAYRPLLEQYKDLADNSEKFCKGDVKTADGQLDDFLQRLALSVQSADICKCQLTSTSTGSGLTGDKCAGVMDPLTCIQNVNQPGCSFSSVGCSPGSTIAGCRNPIGMTNPNSSGIAMPASGFAGPGFASTGGGGGNSGKVGVGGDDFNFSDDARPSGSGTATADAGSPFGVAAGGGGGAGGSAGGGGGGGTGDGGGAGDEKKEGGISGFFQNAKGGIASLFGAGADNKNAAVKKPDNKAYKNDVNGFRPKAGVRGMAGGSNEFGSKNRDIWKTMNERYNDQYHTFITVENPSK